MHISLISMSFFAIINYHKYAILIIEQYQNGKYHLV